MYELSKREKWIPENENKYFANLDGEIFRIYKNGKIKKLRGFKKGRNYVVKINRQNTNVNRIIWETFRGPIPPNYVIARKTKILSENNLLNLKLISRKQNGIETGSRSRSKGVVLLDSNGEIIDSWSSARKAAKELYVSYQTVSDICNKKVKKKLFNLRWEKESDLKHPAKKGEFLRIRSI